MIIYEDWRHVRFNINHLTIHLESDLEPQNYPSDYGSNNNNKDVTIYCNR